MRWSGEFLRIRVNLDVTNPLPKGNKVNSGTEKSCWIRFSYKHLSNFCYSCGHMRHGYKNCEQRGRPITDYENQDFTYNQWLHVGNQRGKDWLRAQWQPPRTAL